MKSQPSELRALALHLEQVSVNNRKTHGWTYDEEVKQLNTAADDLARAQRVLRHIAHAGLDAKQCMEAALFALGEANTANHARSPNHENTK